MKEALKLALDELENCADLLKVFEAPIDSCVGAAMLGAEKAATAIKEALAQPEEQQSCDKQEPVAYIKAAELEELKHCNGMSLWAENAAVHTDDSISKQLLPSGHVPVYTTPPQRTAAEGEDTRRAWVGLTDEEIDEWTPEIHAVIQAIEVKLKEKNT